jgi:hypothetical protein
VGSHRALGDPHRPRIRHRDHGRVTVFKGVPGGVFLWDPTVERTTTLRGGDLRPAELSSVRDEPKFSSIEDANAYVRRLRARSTS